MSSPEDRRSSGVDLVVAALAEEHDRHRRWVLETFAWTVVGLPVAAGVFGGNLVAARMMVPLVAVGLASLGAIVLARRGRIHAGFGLIVAIGSVVAIDAHAFLRVSEVAPAYPALLLAVGAIVLGSRELAYATVFLLGVVLVMRIARIATGDGTELWLPSTLDGLTITASVGLVALVDRRRVEGDRRALENALLDLEHQRAHLVALHREANRSAVEARTANAAKSEFLTRVSHELRTPLNTILGYAEMIGEDPGIDASVHDDVSRIEGAGRHLLGLVDEVLDLSRIETGALEVRLESSTLEVLLKPVIDDAHPGRNDNQLTVIVDDATAELDLERTRQVLGNLLSNACRFTERGTITVRATATADEVTLEVRDTGIGIRAERIPFVFQPFVQAEADTAYRYGGTGLGLTIVRQLVRVMRGRVEVESELGRGSLFRVVLPRRGEAPSVHT